MSRRLVSLEETTEDAQREVETLQSKLNNQREAWIKRFNGKLEEVAMLRSLIEEGEEEMDKLRLRVDQAERERTVMAGKWEKLKEQVSFWFGCFDGKRNSLIFLSLARWPIKTTTLWFAIKNWTNRRGPSISSNRR